MPYCTKCGFEVNEDAQFCPNCGTALKPVNIVRETKVSRQRREKYEKDEKQEKGEKQEKNEKDEKSGKGDDRTSAITGGLILIWLGITFYLATSGIISWINWWAYFLIGFGVILLISATIAYVSNESRRFLFRPIIGGGILIIIGVTSILGITTWWWLILITIGIAIIISGLRERKQTPRP